MSNVAGYCKVCASPHREAIDRHYSQRESTRVIAQWLDEIGYPISRPTLERHRAHAIAPEVAALEVSPPGEKRTLGTIRVSSTEFLEAVVSEGYSQIEKNPEKVKVDQALRAAIALERKKEDGKGQMRVLVLALTGHTAPVTIRGNYEQLEGSN